ncbi:MAG: SH3 domain-containing protein [Bacteroidota bacterium]
MSSNTSENSEYEQLFNSTDSSLQDSQVGQAGRDLNQNRVVNNGWMNCLYKVHHTVNNFFHVSFDAISQKINSFFNNVTPNSIQDDPQLIELQTQYSSELLHVKEQELQLTQARLEYTVDATERMISIKQQELELATQKFELEKFEASIKNRFFNRKINLIKECHEENIKLRSREIQANWDSLRLPLIFSREEAVDFIDKRFGNFCILLAPPKIPSYIKSFEHLAGDISYEINSAINSFFINNQVNYPIKFYTFFSRDILPAEAISIRNTLAPVQTLILSSEVTDREVRTCVTYPISLDSNSPNFTSDNQIQLEAWDWKDLQVKLESHNITSEDSIFSVRKLIAFFHKILAIYFSDLYCFSIDPYHDPKLFLFLESTDFPEILKEWVKPYRDSMAEIQSRIKEIEREKFERRKQQPEVEYAEAPSTYESFTYSDDSDWEWPQIVGIGIGLMFLLGFCSQVSQPRQVSQDRNTLVVPIEQPTGIIQAGSEYSGANLRDAPNGQKIGFLSNGTNIILGEINSDGTWQQVTAPNGQSGWVWAAAIQQFQ